MKKITILLFIISMLVTVNVYADYYSDLTGKLACIENQRKEREPIEVELKGRREQAITIYKVSNIKIKDEKPKKD